MNAPEALLARLAAAPALHCLALAALAPADDVAGAEADWLRAQRAAAAGHGVAAWLLAPPAHEVRLRDLVRAFGLGTLETLALSLTLAVELDPMVGRVLSWLQAPVGGARPSLGLLLTVAQTLQLPDAPQLLAEGPARQTGLLQTEPTAHRPWPEQVLHTPLPIVLALAGRGGQWPGVRVAAPADVTADAPPSLREAAARHAAALQAAAAPSPMLAVRSGHPRQAQAGAALVAAALGARAAFFEGEAPPGLAPWLWLQGALPVCCVELAPGEVRRLAAVPGHAGVLLLASGLDGSLECQGSPIGHWTVPLPLPAERVALWRAHVPAAAAQQLGLHHRHAPAHIQDLAQAAGHQARLAGQGMPTDVHVRRAARQGAAGDLGALAQLMPDDVPEAALVMPPELRAAMHSLRQRCLRRELLAERLGAAARTRYRPGVRALLVGASGTGKTLAVGWLATQLGLPLYRVDLAAVASKYIGETEKNLAQLFGRAEHAEVVLLFDEADSLFGKRTDVKDANDRYANQQTNYLLQRIESFDGIALLTSNSRARFDSAFTRRLDAIIDFPLPGPEERRALWQAHLGAQHSLDATQLNRLAACCDLVGGHIRNAVLAAASLEADSIGYAALQACVVHEYRKLGRQPPTGL